MGNLNRREEREEEEEEVQSEESEEESEEEPHEVEGVVAPQPVQPPPDHFDMIMDRCKIYIHNF